MGSIVVFVTCASAREAHHIARALVQKKLAACVNTTGPLKSVYRWKGKVESASEILMLIKTTRKKFAALEKEIRHLHSYDTPEVIAVPILSGSAPYLRWLVDSVKTSG